MSNGLTTTRLEGIGPVRMCKRVLKSQTSEKAEIPFFKISTFGDKPDTYIEKSLYDEFREKYSFPKKGDILISAAGTVGKTVIYDGRPAYFQDSNIVWIENDESQLLNKYLYYFYQTKPWQTTNGSTIKRIYNDDLKSIKISFPDIPSQQKITSILSVLDDKIELNNVINGELEQMAKTLYDYWFVQFDFPDANGKPYKSSGGAMVYNEVLKREIPKDWSAISIEELLATSKNGDWGEDVPDSNLMQVYCVRGADINALNGQSVTLEPPVRYIRKDHTDRLLKPDDLIVEISGGSPTQSTGRIAHIGEKVFGRFETPLVCSNFCKAISFKEKSHSYIVKQYWNKLYEAGIFFNFEGKTSGIKNLMFDRLIQDVYIATPSDKKIIEEFHKMSIKNDEIIQNNLLQNKKLAELRDWLLPMLMNGQVSVK